MLFVTVLVSPFQKVWSRHPLTWSLGGDRSQQLIFNSIGCMDGQSLKHFHPGLDLKCGSCAERFGFNIFGRKARGNFYRWPEETLHCQLPNIVVTMQCRRPYNNNNNIQLFAVVKPHRHSFGQNSSLAKMHLIFASGLRSASFKANRHNLDPWFCHSPHPPLCHSFPGCYHQTFATPTFYNAPLPHPALKTTPRHLQKSFQPSGALGPIYRYFFQPLCCCLQR